MSAGTVTIATVVEGYGEVPSLPKLLYRLAAHHSIHNLRTPKPWREPRDRLIKIGGIEQVVSTVAAHVNSAGGVLVVIDADDDCPAQLGPALLQRAQNARPDIPVKVVLAKREFEAWFLTAAPSLAGVHGLAPDLPIPSDPESIRGAKEWLADHRLESRTYKPTIDQKLLVSAFDIDMSRKNSDSFDKFCRDVESLFTSGRATREAPGAGLSP